MTTLVHKLVDEITEGSVLLRNKHGALPYLFVVSQVNTYLLKARKQVNPTAQYDVA